MGGTYKPGSGGGGGGGGSGTHTSGTLAALPASPVAGDTYAVTSGTQTGARYTCFVTGTWEGTMPELTGYSWDRLDPATAGVGGRFTDRSTRVRYVSTGLAASAEGWSVELGSGLGADRAGLALNGGTIVATAIDLSAYTANSTTMAALFTWVGPVVGGYSTLFALGAPIAGTSGIGLYLKTNSGNTDLVAITGVGGATTVLAASLNPAAGLHAVCVAPVIVGGVHKWRWSFDGSAVVDTNMTANYVPPTTSAEIGAGSRSDGPYSMVGQVHDVAVWGSLLSSADIVALTTLPGTATYRLPVSSSTGAPPIRIEANRYDPILPLVLPVKGLPLMLPVGSAIRKASY